MTINTNVRYWPDAIVPILNGNASTEFADFRNRAKMLVDFRAKGTEPLSEELATPEKLEQNIKDFYCDYCSFTQIVNVSERVDALSKNRFMQEVCSSKEGCFDEAETYYLKKTGFPGAMKATPGGVDLLGNSKAKNWLRTYYFAISTAEGIKNNVNAYRGLPITEIKRLSGLRGLASGWFKHYPQEVNKHMIAYLKQVLEMDSLGIPHSSISADSLLFDYYDRYLKLAGEFRQLDRTHPAIGKDGQPYSREKAYWDSIQSNFDRFLISAQ